MNDATCNSRRVINPVKIVEVGKHTVVANGSAGVAPDFIARAKLAVNAEFARLARISLVLIREFCAAGVHYVQVNILIFGVPLDMHQQKSFGELLGGCIGTVAVLVCLGLGGARRMSVGYKSPPGTIGWPSRAGR